MQVTTLQTMTQIALFLDIKISTATLASQLYIQGGLGVDGIIADPERIAMDGQDGSTQQLENYPE